MPTENSFGSTSDAHGRAEHHPVEYVAAELVGAERVLPRRRLQPIGHRHLVGPARGEHAVEQGDQDHDAEHEQTERAAAPTGEGGEGPARAHEPGHRVPTLGSSTA